MQAYQLDERQLSTILAALRAYQNVQQHEALDEAITAIATNDGSCEPLDDDEIDALAEYLNSEGDTRAEKCATFTHELASGKAGDLYILTDERPLTPYGIRNKAREILGMPAEVLQGIPVPA